MKEQDALAAEQKKRRDEERRAQTSARREEELTALFESYDSTAKRLVRNVMRLEVRTVGEEAPEIPVEDFVAYFRGVWRGGMQHMSPAEFKSALTDLKAHPST